ncbi:unnamed protein product [Rhizoctonia solani]|uniref:Fungal-type protein kinase domain-containing protein n=1 Tax=Rhizoctonia solani TaxID=456999 RepID=A0A8H2WC28_9AGAM|nr:unnamed protein product [Rhizoctonia solani]
MELDMDRSLEKETRGEIFCDPSFVQNFLRIKKEHWHLLEAELGGLQMSQNTPDNTLKAESTLYKPILEVLQSIKNAVDTFRATHHLGTLGTSFCDSHKAATPGDGPDIPLLKPDLVLFEEHDLDRRSWETLMVPIEVKAKRTYLKVGMKLLARYARTVFAHQIHRRHLYGLVICKWAATFVRFDRSGIICSEPIDILESPEEFYRAFAGLMMLDRKAFGYDTAFTTVLTSGGRLEYYVDLPGTAFPSNDTDCVQPSPMPQRLELPTRRFKVKERLFHRKRICGQGSAILRLHEVQKCAKEPESEISLAGLVAHSLAESQSSQPAWEELSGAPEYVLKIQWRDPNKRREGTMMKYCEGEFGVAQCQWYSDALLWGASCHRPGAISCDACSDATPDQEVRPVENLEDIDVDIANEKLGKEPQHVEVDTDQFAAGLGVYRVTRIYSWALFSTVGRPLCTAESPRQFLEAVLDSLLGYWVVFNRGILHRHIGEGSILIADPGQGYNIRKWKLEQEPMGQTTGSQDELAESKRLAQETITRLGRDPSGFLWGFAQASTTGGLEHDIFRCPTAKRRCSDAQMSDAKAESDVEPPAKRERREAGVPGAVFIPDADEVRDKQKPEEPVLPTNMPKQLARIIPEYRTSAPAFTSIRVLKIGEDVRFTHGYMDDVESFFWVILWCVVKHKDPHSDENSNQRRTRTATSLLHKLNRLDPDLLEMADSKRSFLDDCTDSYKHRPCTMQRRLEDCQNSWASHPAIIDVIVNLGAHFHGLDTYKHGTYKCEPEVEFPKIVDIIVEGLKQL